MQEFARTDPGLVLEMRILRERSIYENRKPWNRGSFKLGPWQSKGETTRFYARFAGKECGDYAGISRAALLSVHRGRGVIGMAVESAAHPPRPASARAGTGALSRVVGGLRFLFSCLPVWQKREDGREKVSVCDSRLFPVQHLFHVSLTDWFCCSQQRLMRLASPR